MTTYDVFGIGNPIFDIIIQSDYEMLDSLGLTKGSMNLVDVDRQKYILSKHSHLQWVKSPGGSCPNTMLMISQLGGSSALLGKVGQDKFGTEYTGQLQNYTIKSLLKRCDYPTGSTVILVTPDGDRTMNTHLGACQQLNKNDLDLTELKRANLLYVTGYQWDTPPQKETVVTALEFAKSNKIKIALSLSDLFCVEKHKKDFDRLLDQYVDLVFCNEQEAQSMTGCNKTEEQIAKLAESVDHVVITLGKKGSLVSHHGQLVANPIHKTKMVDSTGAGDAFAAGYLYALTQQTSIEKAGALASLCAGTIVGLDGPRYTGNFQKIINENFES